MSDVTVSACGKLHGGRGEVYAVGQVLPCAGFCKQLIGIFKHMLISALGPYCVGVGTAIGKVIRVAFALFRKPEAQGVCCCLPCFVIREAGGFIVGIAIHEYGVYTGKRTPRKDGGWGSFGICLAMRVPCGMLHAVDYFACLFNPMAGRIQVVP